MTIVTNVLVDDTDTPLSNIYVEVRLLAPTDSSPAFYAENQVVSRVVTRTVHDGSWTLNFIPNSLITPSNSVYEVTQKIPGFPDQVAAFIVPNDDATHNLDDLLTQPPGDLPVAASLIAFEPEDGMTATNVEDAILEAFTSGQGGGGGGSFPDFSGSGSPEGVQTASRGQSYRDTTNGADYNKYSGDATNTGWAAAAHSGSPDTPGVFVGDVGPVSILSAAGKNFVLTDLGGFNGTGNGVYWNVPGGVDGAQRLLIELGPSDEFEWSFAADGSTSFPGPITAPGVIIDTANGVSIVNETNGVIITNDGDGGTVITDNGAGGLQFSSAAAIVQALQDGSLFLISNGGSGVNVEAGGFITNFNADGSTSFPGPITVVPSAGPSSIPGVPTVRKFPFAFDTPDILTGAAVYTPTIDDVLLDAWVEIDEAWDGTTPIADIGPFNSETRLVGLFNFALGNGVSLDLHDITGGPGVGVGILLGNTASRLSNADAAGVTFDVLRVPAIASTPSSVQEFTNTFDSDNGARTVPARFTTTDPLRVCVSQDGTNTGADPGSTQGAAVLYLVVCTPV